MDRKKRIDDNVLTRYILGELDMQTALEVEELLGSDTGIKQRVLDMEDQFERLGHENAIEPPEKVRQNLVNAVESGITAGADPIAGHGAALPYWKMGSWRMAAGVAVLFGLSTLWLFMQWQGTRSDLDSLRTESQQLTDRLDALEQEINTVNTKYGQVNHPDVIPLVLEGNDQLPQAKVVAYMNHNSRSVVVNTTALPDLKNTQSYQMWADVDGVMVDMGVLDSGKELVPLRYIDRAESLNITIEPYGGSEHPTVSNLISYVKI